MSKARTLANLISDNAELADGQISVAEVVGAAPTANPTFTGNIDAGDNVKIRLGDSDDLQIYHTGSTSYISDVGDGDLLIQGSNAVRLTNTSGSNYFQGTDGAQVQLYYGGATKLTTTSTGIDVTGAVTSDGLTVGGTTDLGASIMTVVGATGNHNTFAVGANTNNSVTLGNFNTNDTIANLITSSSKFGSIIQGGSNGSLVLGIRDNDIADGIFVMSGTGTGGGQISNDYSRLRLSITPNTFVINETGDDADFRVESDNNTHMLFVEGSSNRVYVGGATNVNTSALQVTGQAAQSAVVTKVVDNNYSLFQGFNASNGLVTQITGAGVLTHNGGAVFNDSSIDSDFRVESDSNTHMLFVDSSQNLIGVNKSSPNSTLDVVATGSRPGIAIASPATQSSQTNSQLILIDSDNTNLRANFMVEDGTGSSSNGSMQIEVTEAGVSNDRDLRIQGSGKTFFGGYVGGPSRVNIADTLALTNSGGGQVLLMGNQDSGGVNNPFKISVGNGSAIIGNGNSWSSPTGGTTTPHLNIGNGSVIVNENGLDHDFRVESDSNANMLFLDASVDRISVGSGSSMDAQLTVQNAQNNGTIGHLAGTEISNNGVRPACLEMIHPINTVSSGTVMTIPITSQGGLWVQYQVELMVVTGEYNMNTNARGGSAKFSFTSLNVVRGFVQQEVTGNISSISVTQNNANACEIRVNFSSGYTAGSSSRNGVCVYAKVLSFAPQYFELDNATLN